MSPAKNPLSHLESLTARERFELMMEAMGRKDERLAQSLADSCPEKLYRAQDQEYLTLMRTAAIIALFASVKMQEALVRMKAAEEFADLAEHLARPVESGGRPDAASARAQLEQATDELFSRIARECLDIETLERRNIDSLDFHNVAVWEVGKALQAASDAGRRAKATPEPNPQPVVVRRIGEPWQRNRRVVIRYICAYCRQANEREEPVGPAYGPLGCPYYDL
jgi:hypothetical protein